MVTTDALSPREVYRVYRGIAVQVSMSPAAQLLAEAARVGPYWPIDAAKWHEYLGLFERADFFAHLGHAASSLDDSGFLPGDPRQDGPPARGRREAAQQSGTR